jgi:hypothetical protein
MKERTTYKKLKHSKISETKKARNRQETVTLKNNWNKREKTNRQETET